jgi:hypothetical protein
MSSAISDMVATLLTMAFYLGITAFLVVSVILFIVDGIKAKREHRKRKPGIKVMFVIAVVLDTIITIAVCVLAAMIAGYIAGL